jgi:hypothetical protein
MLEIDQMGLIHRPAHEGNHHQSFGGGRWGWKPSPRPSAKDPYHWDVCEP